jgi:hypothetical protein
MGTAAHETTALLSQHRGNRRQPINGPVRLLVTAEHRTTGATVAEEFTVWDQRGMDKLRKMLGQCGFRITAVRRVPAGAPRSRGGRVAV